MGVLGGETEGCRELMVQFVNLLVERAPVQCAVSPVVEEVLEDEELWVDGVGSRTRLGIEEGEGSQYARTDLLERKVTARYAAGDADIDTLLPKTRKDSHLGSEEPSSSSSGRGPGGWTFQSIPRGGGSPRSGAARR